VIFTRNFQHLNYCFEEPIAVREDSNGRFYIFPDFAEYPSVTTVLGHKLSEGLVEWQERVGLERADVIKNQAAARGTALHGVCETYLRGVGVNKLKTAPTAFKMFRQIQTYLDRIDNIRCLETPLRSTGRLRVAGRVDCIGEFDRKLSVIDFKSATKPKREDWIENYFLQATCYAMMWNAKSEEQIDQIVIIIGVENGDSQLFIRDTKFFITSLLHSRLEEYHAFQKSSLSSVAEPTVTRT
jgi:hypothetical protein